MNPEITILYQLFYQKSLFKFPKICNINFWTENDPPPLWKFPKNSSVLETPPVPNALSYSAKRVRSKANKNLLIGAQLEYQFHLFDLSHIVTNVKLNSKMGLFS